MQQHNYFSLQMEAQLRAAKLERRSIKLMLSKTRGDKEGGCSKMLEVMKNETEVICDLKENRSA